MKRCAKHPLWHIPDSSACPDCLLARAGDDPVRLGEAAIAAALTMDTLAQRLHILGIEKRFGKEQAIEEARRFQGEPETGRSWPPKFIPMVCPAST